MRDTNLEEAEDAHSIASHYSEERERDLPSHSLIPFSFSLPSSPLSFDFLLDPFQLVSEPWALVRLLEFNSFFLLIFIVHLFLS